MVNGANLKTFNCIEEPQISEKINLIIKKFHISDFSVFKLGVVFEAIFIFSKHLNTGLFWYVNGLVSAGAGHLKIGRSGQIFKDGSGNQWSHKMDCFM